MMTAAGNYLDWEAISALGGGNDQLPPIPDPEGRFSGLVHGGISTITTAGGEVMLDSAVSYRLQSGEVSTVREGFIFDWASIPRIFAGVLPPSGDGKNCYGIAALFHDWLYCHRKIGGRPVTRAECDEVFLEIMLYVGVSRWLARTMWLAVRLAGWVPWARRRADEII